MIAKKRIPVNTLESALALARQVSRDLRQERRTRQNYQLFAALTGDELEALLAFLIWRARGESIRHLLRQE